MIRTICVFCGANLGKNPEFEKTTHAIGRILGHHGIGVVCGGSQRGLMGVITNSVVDSGGTVVGVLADVLENIEIPHDRLSDLIRTPCLPTRKQKMMNVSDAFLVLPGGYGTMDELFEIMVLRKLGFMQKPIIVFNYRGFWDATFDQIDRMVSEGFVPAQDGRDLMTIVDRVEEVDDFLTQYNGIGQTALRDERAVSCGL